MKIKHAGKTYTENKDYSESSDNTITFSPKITYKKGQIAPFFLAETRPRKYAHLIKFGCDVNVVGRTIKALSEGPVIVVGGEHKGKKGKPNCYPYRHFKDLQIYTIDCGFKMI